MDRLRVKHVVNQITADLTEQAKYYATPANYASLVRRLCMQVAALLIWGSEAYRRLELEPADNYHKLRRPADLVFHAVLRAAYSWNWDMEGPLNPVKVFLDPFTLAYSMADHMKSCEVYFQDHPEKVLAYDLRYTSIDKLLDAPVDVEAFGEPYEMAPLPLSNGRIGCFYCDRTMKDMDVLATHHEAMHRNHGRVACTDCTWTSADTPGVLAHHLQADHDVYPPGHPHFFSMDADHILAMPKESLVQLVHDDYTTFAKLRNQPAPYAPDPDGWSQGQFALALITIRGHAKMIPGWQQEAERAWAKRVAQK